jgi:hypothetical protein
MKKRRKEASHSEPSLTIFIQQDRRTLPSVHILIGPHRVRNEIFDRTGFFPRHLHGEKFVDTHTLCMDSYLKPLLPVVEHCFLSLPPFLINSHFVW